MSHLAFHGRTATIYLSGREVHHIASLARDALADEPSLAENRQLRCELGLPAPDSMFLASQVFWLMSDGETHRIRGQDVYLFDLALNVLYRRQPAAGILCWLFDNALAHGWVAGADRHAVAGQIQAALDPGVARPGMAELRPDGWSLPPLATRGLRRQRAACGVAMMAANEHGRMWAS
jgi:hypothetical protein